MADSPLRMHGTTVDSLLDRPGDRWLPARQSPAGRTDSLDWQAQVAASYERLRSRVRKPRTHYYYQRIQAQLAQIVEPNARVLDIGCSNGDLLAYLKPAYGVGVDLDGGTLEQARTAYPDLRFEQMRGEDVASLGETFDYVVISQVLGEVYDLCDLFRAVQAVCHPRTRVVVVHWSRVWQPALRVAEWLRIKPKKPEQNWIPADEVRHLLKLSGFETMRLFGMTLAPLKVPLLSSFINRFVANMPLLHYFGLNYVAIARPVFREAIEAARPKSVSIVVPARNEAGHIEPLLRRLPQFAPRQEVIFVEGNSTDDTWDVIQRVASEYDGPFEIKTMRQPGKGKGDAVRHAFAQATGDVLMILDADISVPPEELPQFYEALASGQGEFINGSRLVYMMDDKAMRFLNLLGNKFFGWMFTYLLSQRFRDTLCGTKVLRREDYERIAANRVYFGDFDPFGDFDLLFGAAKLNLKIVDVPVHYKARTYGDTNISRFSQGWLLLRMCLFAARKLKLA